MDQHKQIIITLFYIIMAMDQHKQTSKQKTQANYILCYDIIIVARISSSSGPKNARKNYNNLCFLWQRSGPAIRRSGPGSCYHIINRSCYNITWQWISSPAAWQPGPGKRHTSTPMGMDTHTPIGTSDGVGWAHGRQPRTRSAY